MGETFSILDTVSKAGALMTWLLVGWAVIKKNGPIVLRRELENEQRERVNEREMRVAAEMQLRALIPILQDATHTVVKVGEKAIEAKEAIPTRTEGGRAGH